MDDYIASRLVGGVIALALVLSSLPARAGDAPAKDAMVTIDNFAFTPEVLTVKAGTKVVFVNHDDIPHTVMADHKEFRSKALDTDDRFEFTFATPGDVPYFCGLHPHMKGRIVVTPNS
jgi:plastocyanin